MKFNFFKMAFTALVLSLGVFALPAVAQAAGPVVDTYAINANGDPAGFVALAKKVFDKAKELDLKIDGHIYVSEIGGRATNTVFVIVEHASLAALESDTEKLFGTEEWATFMEATRQKGMKTKSRQVLREIYHNN